MARVNRCLAWVPRTTYQEAHPCTKPGKHLVAVTGNVTKHYVCTHHRNSRDAKKAVLHWNTGRAI